MNKEEMAKMKKAPCYPGTKLVENPDGSGYTVVRVACPPDCWCPNKCMEDEEV